jgi:hypothetical protein
VVHVPTGSSGSVGAYRDALPAEPSKVSAWAPGLSFIGDDMHRDAAPVGVIDGERDLVARDAEDGPGS